MGSKLITLSIILIIFTELPTAKGNCQECYNRGEDLNCELQPTNISSHTLHMAVHPHLDAFWIFDF